MSPYPKLYFVSLFLNEGNGILYKLKDQCVYASEGKFIHFELIPALIYFDLI
jgi:hypothetical protein